jgi:hypothetical protein
MAITALATLASGVTYTAAAGFAFSMTMGTFLTNLALGAALRALTPKPFVLVALVYTMKLQVRITSTSTGSLLSLDMRYNPLMKSISTMS